MTQPAYCALVHHPIRDRQGETITTAVTNLDVHDIARTARTYDLAGYFVVTPLEAQHRLVERILGHWIEGAGAKRVPERTEALRITRIMDSVEAARDAIAPLWVISKGTLGTLRATPILMTPPSWNTCA